MNKPTFEFIKDYFNNCVIIYSAYFEEPFDITEYDFNTLYEHNGSVYIVHKTKKDHVKSLFDTEKGLAKK